MVRFELTGPPASERLSRAPVINAEGEQQAAEKLVEAGRAMAQEPLSMQLRYFAALHDIAGSAGLARERRRRRLRAGLTALA